VDNDAGHDESEPTLAALGADEYEAIREAVVALVHAVLSIAASLTPTTEGTTP
jgi:hypothetical protein